MDKNVEAVLAAEDMPIIYIAGPYTSPDPVQNTRIAIEHGFRVYEEGGWPLVPHTTMIFHLVELHDVDFWYRFDLHAMKHVHAVWRFKGASSGADAEVDFARRLGIPVFEEDDDGLGWDALVRFMTEWPASRAS